MYLERTSLSERLLLVLVEFILLYMRTFPSNQKLAGHGAITLSWCSCC